MSGQPDQARPVLATLAANKDAPDWLPAWSYLYEARADDLSGRREMAKKEYHAVLDNFEKQRAVDAARVGLMTPYTWPETAR